jgi:hypothetical protein
MLAAMGDIQQLSNTPILPGQHSVYSRVPLGLAWSSQWPRMASRRHPK